VRALLLALSIVAAGNPPARRPLSTLRKLCDADDARACAELARRYRVGDGVPRDPVKWVEALQDGCEAGEPALCVEAGRAVLRGEGVKPDAALARELFSDACTQRTHAGCLDLALMLQKGEGVPQDHAAAAALFEKGCRGGDAVACQLHGDAHYLGYGSPKDVKAAEKSYRKACGMELHSACTKLADLLRVSGAPAKADELYKKACAADEKNACAALALEKGCDTRDACLDLSDLCSDYLAGYEVLAEPSLARAPCEKACAGGVGEACDNLADMYQEGSGVPRDAIQAAALRKRACSLGDRDACDVRE
jgi:TPR repeat protein